MSVKTGVNPDYHIWGFEEPENSLELASAIEEAARFLELSKSYNKQIFVTSHSPAFFRTIASGSKRYFVSKSILSGLLKESSSAQEIDGMDANSVPADLMGETPHLAIISSYLDDAAKKIDALEMQANSLVTRVKQSSTPILFVEGETDARILRAAWNRYVGESHELRIESCAGTTKMESLSANGSVLRTLAPERSMYVLVDNDGAGRDVHKDGKLSVNGGRWVQHNSNKTWWCRLELPDEFIQTFTDFGVVSSRWPGTLENIFPTALRLQAIQEGSYEQSSSPFEDLLNGESFPKISASLQGDESSRMYVSAPTPESKDTFADWLIQKSGEDSNLFSPLRSVVLGLYALTSPAA